MTDVHVVNKKKQRKYIDSYNRKEKMIDVHTINQKKSKESTQILTIWKKKMIDVHAVNNNKVHRFLQYQRKK